MKLASTVPDRSGLHMDDSQIMGPLWSWDPIFGNPTHVRRWSALLVELDDTMYVLIDAVP